MMLAVKGRHSMCPVTIELYGTWPSVTMISAVSATFEWYLRNSLGQGVPNGLYQGVIAMLQEGEEEYTMTDRGEKGGT